MTRILLLAMMAATPGLRVYGAGMLHSQCHGLTPVYDDDGHLRGYRGSCDVSSWDGQTPAMTHMTAVDPNMLHGGPPPMDMGATSAYWHDATTPHEPPVDMIPPVDSLYHRHSPPSSPHNWMAPSLDEHMRAHIAHRHCVHRKRMQLHDFFHRLFDSAPSSFYARNSLHDPYTALGHGQHCLHHGHYGANPFVTPGGDSFDAYSMGMMGRIGHLQRQMAFAHANLDAAQHQNHYRRASRRLHRQLHSHYARLHRHLDCHCHHELPESHHYAIHQHPLGDLSMDALAQPNMDGSAWYPNSLHAAISPTDMDYGGHQIAMLRLAAHAAQRAHQLGHFAHPNAHNHTVRMSMFHPYRDGGYDEDYDADCMDVDADPTAGYAPYYPNYASSYSQGFMNAASPYSSYTQGYYSAPPAPYASTVTHVHHTQPDLKVEKIIIIKRLKVPVKVKVPVPMPVPYLVNVGDGGDKGTTALSSSSTDSYAMAQPGYMGNNTYMVDSQNAGSPAQINTLVQALSGSTATTCPCQQHSATMLGGPQMPYSQYNPYAMAGAYGQSGMPNPMAYMQAQMMQPGLQVYPFPSLDSDHRHGHVHGHWHEHGHWHGHEHELGHGHWHHHHHHHHGHLHRKKKRSFAGKLTKKFRKHARARLVSTALDALVNHGFTQPSSLQATANPVGVPVQQMQPQQMQPQVPVTLQPAQQVLQPAQPVQPVQPTQQIQEQPTQQIQEQLTQPTQPAQPSIAETLPPPPNGNAA